jgi:hypothetical protein
MWSGGSVGGGEEASAGEEIEALTTDHELLQRGRMKIKRNKYSQI